MAFSNWALWCVGLALVAGCGDKRASSGAAARPRVGFLEGAALLEGRTVALSRRSAVTLGTWDVLAEHGREIHSVPDGGDWHEAVTFVAGPDGALGQREIRFPIPPELEPDQLLVRYLAPAGGELALRVRSFDPSLAPPPWVPCPGGEAIGEVTLDLDPEDTTAQRILEVGGGCLAPSIVELTLLESVPAGSLAKHHRQGPPGDRRRAISLADGARLRVDVQALGPRRLSLSLAAVGADPAALRVRTISQAGQSTEHRWHAGPRWASYRADFGGDPEVQALEFTCEGPGGIWVAEERIDLPQETPPTVVLITSDTHRWDHVGYLQPGSGPRTPNLDQLAASGTVFTDAWAPTNVTNPSHMSLMTGLDLRATHIFDNSTALAMGAHTLAESFQRAGYRTFAAVSVGHMSPATSNLHQGFDRYDAPRLGKRNGAEAVATLRNWLPDAEGDPLFLWLHLYDAHGPYEPPADLISANYAADRDPKDPARSLEIHEQALPAWVRAAGYTDREYVHALYRAGTEYVDRLIGDFLAEPRLQGATLAVTADHGESLGDDGVFWDHTRLNHSTVHVPLLLKGPGVAAGRNVDPVNTIDLGHTLLALAGIPGGFPGQDLLAAKPPGEPFAPRFAISAHLETALVESGGWLLVMQLRPYFRKIGGRDWDFGELELFHLNEDPLAEHNLLEAELARATRMRTALIGWLNGGSAQGLAVDAVLSEEDRSTLEALGYTGSRTTTSGAVLWDPPGQAPWVQRFEDR
ncbi:MAG: sulfatase [Planctomycetota bacterium]